MRNYVVKWKKLKKGLQSFSSYFTYLINDNHTNHTKEGHRIVNLSGAGLIQTKYKNMTDKLFQEMDAWEQRPGPKGQPPSKFAQSITIDLPFHFKDDEEAKKAIFRTINHFLDEINKREGLGLSKDELDAYRKNMTFFNLHIQPKGSMTQFNILLSPYIRDDIKIDWTKKQYLTQMKVSNTEIVKRLGHDPKKYKQTELNREIMNTFKKAVETNPGVNTQTFFKQVRQEINQKHLDYREQMLNEEIQAHEKRKELLQKIKDQILFEWENHKKKSFNYFNRLFQGLKDGDIEKIEKNLRYLKKSLPEESFKEIEEQIISAASKEETTISTSDTSLEDVLKDIDKLYEDYKKEVEPTEEEYTTETRYNSQGIPYTTKVRKHK